MEPVLTQREPTLRPPFARVLNILLLQVRDQERALMHERLCFLERLSMEPEQVRSINLCREAVPTVRQARDFDLVILGGAGTHSAYDDHDWTPGLLELVQELVERGHPFFGSCFGHQFLGRAMGGRVVADAKREEIGTFDITLTDAGRSDELFQGFPATFPVHLGHHDRVVELPDGAISLAHSERCPHQVIRMAGKPVYGTQFHSEMSEDHMRERLLMYADEYLAGEDALEVLSRHLHPTVLVDRLLRRFVDVFVA